MTRIDAGYCRMEDRRLAEALESSPAALALQQLKYLEAQSHGKEDGGRRWLYYSYAEWAREFGVPTRDTARGAIKRLEDLDLIAVKTIWATPLRRNIAISLDHEAIAAFEREVYSDLDRWPLLGQAGRIYEALQQLFADPLEDEAKQQAQYQALAEALNYESPGSAPYALQRLHNGLKASDSADRGNSPIGVGNSPIGVGNSPIDVGNSHTYLDTSPRSLSLDPDLNPDPRHSSDHVTSYAHARATASSAVAAAGSDLKKIDGDGLAAGDGSKPDHEIFKDRSEDGDGEGCSLTDQELDEIGRAETRQTRHEAPRIRAGTNSGFGAIDDLMSGLLEQLALGAPPPVAGSPSPDLGPWRPGGKLIAPSGREYIIRQITRHGIDGELAGTIYPITFEKAEAFKYIPPAA